MTKKELFRLKEAYEIQKKDCTYQISEELMDKAIKALEQGPCEDAIDRQDVLRLLACSVGCSNTFLQMKVFDMPSVNPVVSEEDMLPRQLFFDFRDKLNKWMFHNSESVCGNNMIDIGYLDGYICELFDELGVIKYDENGNRIED